MFADVGEEDNEDEGEYEVSENGFHVPGAYEDNMEGGELVKMTQSLGRVKRKTFVIDYFFLNEIFYIAYMQRKMSGWLAMVTIEAFVNKNLYALSQN